MAFGVVRQALVDLAEIVLMHEGQVILQMTALGAQHLQQVESAPAGADYQQMRTQQRMTPKQRKAGPRGGGASGETAKGQHAQRDRDIQAEDRRNQTGRRHRKRGDHGNTAQRLVQATDAILAIQPQSIKKAELENRKQQGLGDGRALQEKIDRQGPESRDRKGIEQKQGKTGSHKKPFKPS